MKSKVYSTLYLLLLPFIMLPGTSSARELFSTSFGEADNWDNPGGTWGSYNEKTYAKGDWFFHGMHAVRGTPGHDETYGGSLYSFRDRDVFTVHNTGAVEGIDGFSMQLRDWMADAGTDRDLKISTDGGTSWETLVTLNREWFEEYQVYQEYVHMFSGGPQNFAAEEFLIRIDGGENDNTGRINIGRFAVFGESNVVAVPTISPDGGTFHSAVEVILTTTTAGATIHYTTDGSEPTMDDQVFVDPFIVDGDHGETVTVKAFAVMEGLEDSGVASADFHFTSITEVASIAELQEIAVLDGTVYRITGEVFLSYKNDERNQKYFQDALDGGAGIKVDDVSGHLDTPVDIGDGITGLTGTLSQHNQMLQINPLVGEAPDVASSTGNELIPMQVTLSQLIDNNNFFTIDGDGFSVFQAVLIVVEELQFEQDGIFDHGTDFGEIAISDPTASLEDIDAADKGTLFRVEYADLDYNGTAIPQQPLDLLAIVDQRYENTRIFARSWEDFGDVPSGDASLATFTVGGIDVLGLSGIIVDDPETDPGAILYLDDMDHLVGIVAEPNHPQATVGVTINGMPADHEGLPEQTVEIDDIVVVQVTAEDLTEKFYKISVAEEGLICNGDFEYWTNGLPECWYGERSTIAQGNVNKYDAYPFSGSYAVQLVNEGDAHRRFTTQHVDLEEGLRYDIHFWVKGQGEIRTGLFDDRESAHGYAPYNEYIVIESDEWYGYQQTVEAANTTDIGEFVFSLRNTGEAYNHLQIDLVTVSIAEEEPSEVAHLGELRNSLIGEQYIVTGEVVLTHQIDYRNQKFIGDSHAAILVDDPEGVITTSYVAYDGITGIAGTLSEHNQMLQFTPLQDPGDPTSSGNQVEVPVRTLASLTSQDQARLVRIENVAFSDTGVFDPGTNYSISDPSGTGTFRTNFHEADYIGTPIPETSQSIKVLVMQYLDNIEVTARKLDDFDQWVDVHVTQNEPDLQIYPNPFTSQIHVTTTKTVHAVRVVDATGRVLVDLATPPLSFSLPVRDLPRGIYFVRIYPEEGDAVIRKMIKQ